MSGATAVRKDISASSLRLVARKEKNANVCRRLLGIAHLLENNNRPEAEKTACLTQPSFLIWLKRFNEEGIAGLHDKKRLTRPPKLTPAIQEALKAKFLQGPSKAEGLIRYRLCDLQKFLLDEYQIHMAPSAIWYLLRKLGLHWKMGR